MRAEVTHLKKTVLILLVLVVVAVGWLFISKPRIEIQMTAEQIQSLLDKTFPYEKSHLSLVKTVLSNPEARLEDGSDRIGVIFDISVFVAGVETLKSRVYAETGIRYDAKSASIFLANPELKQFDLQGVSIETERIVRQIVGKSLPDILALQPIYRFDKTDTKAKIAATLLKKISVNDGLLTVVFGL